MAEFVEILSPSALRDLQKANAELLTMIANTNRLGQATANITLPSGASATNQQLLSQIQAQENAIKALQRQLASLNNTRQQSNARTSEEIVNQRSLARGADTLARANSNVVGAYERLNAQHQISSRRLQDLVARGRQATQTQREYDREIRQAQTEFTRLNTRVLAADRAVGRFNRNVGNYPQQAIGGLKDLISAFGVLGGMALGAAIVKDIFTVTKELQSLDLALKQVTETNEQFARSQQFLTEISDKYGIEINALTKQFTQFYVSAKDKISGKEIEGIFESVSKAAGFMGLSVESQERAFVALNQMMSKGTVSAEELKGQLGEALPGAFGIMAKAMGVTERQLGDLMKQGAVMAADVLPKFAKQLEKTYGIENKNRVESLAAAQTRLGNSWTNFIRELNDGEAL